MIKVKSIEYQTDTVQATVEYDLNNEIYSFTVGATLLQIAAMTIEQIKAYTVGRVQSERAAKLRALVESKLNALIDVELELE